MKPISMKRAMVWWNDDSEAADHPGKARIAVLDASHEQSSYMYLSNSSGACDGGWVSSSPRKQAAALLAIYAWATGRDGVPAAEAHQEFMKIAEYRQWREREEGPFAEIYLRD